MEQDLKKEIRILAVEDNLGDILLLTEAFKEGNIPVQMNVVGNGEDALEFLRGERKYAETSRPDLILLDLNLPRMDGRTFLRRLKSDPYLKALPVIVLSSSNLDTDIREVYDMKASCYIVKPSGLDGYYRIASSLKEFWTSQVRSRIPEEE